MASILLIHGAWHGAWCWERVLPLLRQRGHQVRALDLPAHGDDTMRWYRVTLRRYAERVCDAAAGLADPPLVVGHSMGGMVISQAAEDAPERFASLVYLCAFVPLPGDRMLALSRRDAASLVPRHIETRPSGVRFRPDGVAATFCGACDAETARWAAERLRPEPILPMLQRLRARAAPRLPRLYVECTRDCAISLERQRAMARRAGIERVVTLETDHSPFLSAPEQLCELLDAAARRL